MCGEAGIRADLAEDDARRALVAPLDAHYDVLWKAAIFTVFTLAFRVIEELVPLATKYRSLGAAVRHFFTEGRLPNFWVLQMWLYGSLVMYCLVTELGHRLGANNFKQLLLASAPAAAAS